MQTRSKGGDVEVGNLSQAEGHWSHNKVLALISSVENFFEDFFDKSMKKKSIWNNVAEDMHEKGYTCTGLACDKKWRGLKHTYINVLQKRLKGDTSWRFEYFNALHPILGQQIDPDELRQLNLESTNTQEPTEFEDLTNDDGFQWGNEEVNLLLDHIMEYKKAFASEDTAIGTIWEDIAEDMSHIGTEVTSEQCQRKWLNLKDGLRVNQAKAEAMGIVPLWPHYTRTQKVNSTVNVRTEFQMRKLIKTKSQKEPKKSSSKQKDNSSSQIVEYNAFQANNVLARVKNIESALSVKHRLDRLEARVKLARQQRESTRNTNILLAQALGELRRINSALKQEDAAAGVQSVRARPSSPSHEFIIVESYSGQL